MNRFVFNDTKEKNQAVKNEKETKNGIPYSDYFFSKNVNEMGGSKFTSEESKNAKPIC